MVRGIHRLFDRRRQFARARAENHSAMRLNGASVHTRTGGVQLAIVPHDFKKVAPKYSL